MERRHGRGVMTELQIICGNMARRMGYNSVMRAEGRILGCLGKVDVRL